MRSVGVTLLLLAAACSPGHATVTLVQHLVSRNTSCSTVGGCAFTLPGNVTAGNAVVASGTNQGGAVALSIAMTGETWVTGAGWPQSPGVPVNAAEQYWWFVASATGGQAVVTITPASGTNNSISVDIYEVHSTNAGSFTDDTAASHNGSCSSSCTNTLTTTSITPTSSTGDFIAFEAHYSGGTASTTCTPNNSFTASDCLPATYTRGMGLYLITTDTSAHTPSVTTGGTAPTNYATMAFAIKEPAGGGGPTGSKHKGRIL